MSASAPALFSGSGNNRVDGSLWREGHQPLCHAGSLKVHSPLVLLDAEDRREKDENAEECEHLQPS
jgi:hypothetical protein